MVRACSTSVASLAAVVVVSVLLQVEGVSFLPASCAPDLGRCIIGETLASGIGGECKAKAVDSVRYAAQAQYAVASFTAELCYAR